MAGDMAERYLVRDGMPEEQRELTRLCVRATMQSGYDDGFIDRAMPGLTITVPLIARESAERADWPEPDPLRTHIALEATLNSVSSLF